MKKTCTHPLPQVSTHPHVCLHRNLYIYLCLLTFLVISNITSAVSVQPPSLLHRFENNQLLIRYLQDGEEDFGPAFAELHNQIKCCCCRLSCSVNLKLHSHRPRQCAFKWLLPMDSLCKHPFWASTFKTLRKFLQPFSGYMHKTCIHCVES